MPRARIRHAHSSSRYDRSPASLLRAALTYLTRATLVTFTEVSNRRRARVLRGLTGMRWVQATGAPGADECGLLFSRLRYRYLTHQSLQLSRTGLARRGGQQVYGLGVCLQHRRTGRRVLVVVVHLPSDVEGRGGMSGSGVTVYRQCITALSRYVTRHLDREPDLAVIVAGDWNLDARLPWVHRTLSDRLHPLRSSWHRRNRPLPDAGTHGRRLIDDTWSNLQLHHVDLLPDDSSSDHRPYLDVFLLPA